MQAHEILDQPPKILCIAPPASGKTSLMMTGGCDIEVLDLDGNLRSGLFCGDGLDDTRRHCSVVDAREIDPMSKPRSFEIAKKWAKEVSVAAAKGEYPFRIAAIDSITALIESAFYYVQGANNNGKPVSLPERGAANREVIALLNRLLGANVAVLILAHDEVVDLGDGQKSVRMAIPGNQLKNEIPRKFTDLWYLRTRQASGGKQAFEVLTTPYKTINCRASGDLEGIVDASKGLEPIFAKLNWPIQPLKNVGETKHE